MEHGKLVNQDGKQAQFNTFKGEDAWELPGTPRKAATQPQPPVKKKAVAKKKVAPKKKKVVKEDL